MRIGELPIATEATPWLIEDIWSMGAGIIGGNPKCAKSWFGLEMALSVASGTPFLGRFRVPSPGPVVVYLAEDALPDVRARVAGLCTHRKLAMAVVDLHVITAPSVRLDKAEDLEALVETVKALAPKMLVLDPLVRLHRQDENDSGAISALLGDLRSLQRTHNLAVVLVHHMAKKRRAQLGQGLRGSGDLHAWVDHGAYLVRTRQGLRLTMEHRSSAAPEPLELRLVSAEDGSATHLEIDGAPPVAEPTPNDLGALVLDALRHADKPVTRSALRTMLRINNNRLGDTLKALEAQGHIRRSDDGLCLAQTERALCAIAARCRARTAMDIAAPLATADAPAKAHVAKPPPPAPEPPTVAKPKAPVQRSLLATADVVATTRAIARKQDSPFAPVYDIVRALVLARLGLSVDDIKTRILEACTAGLIELRPESGMGLLAKQDAALCICGPRGSILSYARVIDPGASSRRLESEHAELPRGSSAR